MSAEQPGPPVNWEAYRHLFREEHVPARTVLLREGEVSRQAYYILRGCLRLWFNNNGKDVTFQFFFEQQGVSSFDSFRRNEPSLFNLETIEASDLLVLTRENMEQLMQEVPGFREYVQESIFQRVGHYARLFLSRIKDTPPQRYLALLEEHPHIIQRVPQHYIASYLGITPVSLSRIRSKLQR